MNRDLLIGIIAFGLASAATTASGFAAAPRGHARTTTALQASLNYCSHQTGGQGRTAPAFQQCMAARGYQLASTMRAATTAARQRVVTQQAAANWYPFHVEISVGSVSSDPTPSPPAYSNQDMLNDFQRMNDSSAAAAQQNNAAMEAATQNQVLFNTVYFPANN